MTAQRIIILLLPLLFVGVHSLSLDAEIDRPRHEVAGRPRPRLWLPDSYQGLDDDDRPTLYDHFVADGVQEGLRADQREHFTLNGKPLTIFSGSLHYFRVHPNYWRDRLRKFRAAGLNAVDIYVPWNLHEPAFGQFDFGSGHNDFSSFLNLTRFLEMVREEDMFAILRPGPYICAEWEFGGLPGWLLSQKGMQVRSRSPRYEFAAGRYLREVIDRVRHLQFYTENGERGGPIIMVQIENEFGYFSSDSVDAPPPDKDHLRFLKSVLETSGVESLLFTSDSPNKVGGKGSLIEDGVLMTANFNNKYEENLSRLLELQPDRPILVSEFWPGWFDHWFEPFHSGMDVEDFTEILSSIFDHQGSVNFYMFHGGTNFGFMNGANVFGMGNFDSYAPDVTSYDYDAPLTEAGHYTAKYDKAAEMISAHDPLSATLRRPARPAQGRPAAYAPVNLTEYLDFETILDNVPDAFRQHSPSLLSMEELSLNGTGSCQNYGYVLYRTRLTGTLPARSTLTVKGHVRDLVQVIVNGKMLNKPILDLAHLTVQFGSWWKRDSQFTLKRRDIPVPEGQTSACDPECTLDLLVENTGRNNFGKPEDFSQQKKGLWEGPVLLDGKELSDWDIVPMEFKSNWVENLQGWRPYVESENTFYSPRVLRGTLSLASEDPQADTYFDFCSGRTDNECSNFLHGALFVNGFNVGRYHQAGPQNTLYIPGPLLRRGDNEFTIFENYLGGGTINFSDEPDYGKTRGRKAVRNGAHESRT